MAQFNVGAIYENEPAPIRDLKKARYWYSMAAAKGYNHARDALARLKKAGLPEDQTR